MLDSGLSLDQGLELSPPVRFAVSQPYVIIRYRGPDHDYERLKAVASLAIARYHR